MSTSFFLNKKSSICYFLCILILNIKCSSDVREKDFPSRSFKNELNYLLSDTVAYRANSFSKAFKETVNKRIFIQFIDGGCTLCALDLKQVEALYEDHFKDRDILPIAFIYGDIDPYVTDIVDRSTIFTYPIYNIENEAFFNSKFVFRSESYLIDSREYELLFEGNPLNNASHLNKFNQALDKLK